MDEAILIFQGFFDSPEWGKEQEGPPSTGNHNLKMNFLNQRAAEFPQLLLLWSQLEPAGPPAPFLRGANVIPQPRFRNLPHRIRNTSVCDGVRVLLGQGLSSGVPIACRVASSLRSTLLMGLPTSAVLSLAGNHPDFHFRR